jgi:hypothetical protein
MEFVTASRRRRDSQRSGEDLGGYAVPPGLRDSTLSLLHFGRKRHKSSSNHESGSMFTFGILSLFLTMTQILSSLLTVSQFYLKCCTLDAFLNSRVRDTDGDTDSPMKAG